MYIVGTQMPSRIERGRTVTFFFPTTPLYLSFVPVVLSPQNRALEANCLVFRTMQLPLSAKYCGVAWMIPFLESVASSR